jgi:hypothetical protein
MQWLEVIKWSHLGELGVCWLPRGAILIIGPPVITGMPENESPDHLAEWPAVLNRTCGSSKVRIIAQVLRNRVVQLHLLGKLAFIL